MAVTVSAVLVLVITAYVVNPAGCHTHPRHSDDKRVALFVFGDSLFDPGNNNYINTTPDYQANFRPYGESFFNNPTGRFSNGRLIPDFIAEFAKLPLIPAYLKPGNHEFSYGANFASGGSGVLVKTRSGLAVDLKTQLRYFKDLRNQLKKKLGDSAAKRLLSNAVYLFSCGVNDYTNANRTSNSIDRFYTREEFVEMVIGNLTEVIKDIYEMRGRKFGLVNLPPVAYLPSSREQQLHNGCNMEDLIALMVLHNHALSIKLNELEMELNGFMYSKFDLYTSLLRRIESPSTYEVAKLCVLFPEQEETEANVKKIFELDPLVRSFKAFPVLFSPEKVEEESPTKPSKMSTATTRSKALVSTADLLAGAKARRSLRKDSKLPPTPVSMASSSVSKNKEESKKRKLVEAADTDASDILDGERTREKFVVVMKDFADKLSGIMTPIMDQAAILKIKAARSSVEAEEAQKEAKAAAGEVDKLKKEAKVRAAEVVKLRKELADVSAERMKENEVHIKELEAAREDFKFNATKALLETRIQMMEEFKNGQAGNWDLEEERRTLEDFIGESVDAEEVNSPALEELIEDANKVLSSMVGKPIEGENQEKETEVTPTAVGQNVDQV